jgi:SAM-dependent methyltransferase
MANLREIIAIGPGPRDSSDACPCCAAATDLRYRLPTKGPRPGEIRQCGSCGFGFIDPETTDGELAWLRGEMEAARAQSPSIESAPNPIEKVRIHLAWRIGRGHARQVDADLIHSTLGGRPGSVRVFGGRRPELLEQLERMGHRVVGPDGGEEAARGGAGGPFDLIYLNQVLQASRHPKASVEEACRLLGAGGRLIVEVPNHECYSARRLGPSWALWDVGNHLNYFTAEGLSRLLEAAECDVEDTLFRQYVPQFTAGRMALERATWDRLYASPVPVGEKPPRRKSRPDLWIDLARTMFLRPAEKYEVVAVIGIRRPAA